MRHFVISVDVGTTEYFLFTVVHYVMKYCLESLVYLITLSLFYLLICEMIMRSSTLVICTCKS